MVTVSHIGFPTDLAPQHRTRAPKGQSIARHIASKVGNTSQRAVCEDLMREFMHRIRAKDNSYLLEPKIQPAFECLDYLGFAYASQFWDEYPLQRPGQPGPLVESAYPQDILIPESSVLRGQEPETTST